MCIIEEEQRYSSSNIKGRTKDIYGYHWQPDYLSAIGKVHGSMAKIVLNRSKTAGWLDFIIYYDDLDSAEKFHHLFQCLNMMNQGERFPGLIAVQTPRDPNANPGQ